jgi:hypothetical protein
MTRTFVATLIPVGLLAVALAGCSDEGQTASPAPSVTAPTQAPTVTPPSPTAPDAGATTAPSPGSEPAMKGATDAPAPSAAPDEGAKARAPEGGAAAEAPAEPAPAEPAPGGGGGGAAGSGERQSVAGLSFEVPQGWTLKPAGGMRLGTVTDGQAEIALSSFPGDVGGKLLNVNRWRGQVGLPPITEADLPKETRTIDVDGKQVMLVDAKGPEMRLLAASIPGDGKLYFARLTGGVDLVEKRKDAFEAFVKSVKVE